MSVLRRSKIEKRKHGKKKYKTYNWRRKGEPEHVMELNPVLREITKFKEKPDSNLSKVSGDPT